jgi:hypothetical protein
MENKTAKVIKSGRIGKIVEIIRIDNVGTIFELAFDGQLWTECYWKSELEITEEVTA